MLREQSLIGRRDLKNRVWQVCKRDRGADGLRSCMPIRSPICKGCFGAIPVKWACQEIYGMEKPCRLTCERSTVCNSVHDNAGVCYASGSFATASRAR